MNLYLIWQDKNNDYDTYDSCIVCAESATEACSIHPSGHNTGWKELNWVKTPNEVNCKLIGIADSAISKGVVLASFNAG